MCILDLSFALIDCCEFTDCYSAFQALLIEHTPTETCQMRLLYRAEIQTRSLSMDLLTNFFKRAFFSAIDECFTVTYLNSLSDKWQFVIMIGKIDMNTNILLRDKSFHTVSTRVITYLLNKSKDGYVNNSS